jgi:succinoglycan biosynthesis protein ExoA
MDGPGGEDAERGDSGARGRPDSGPIACSVLMPVLNEEPQIEASVGAMCSQRFEGRLEFIVVDGGSSDRTVEILHELARRDPRIRVFENPRRITSSGLNVALREARGHWVARMDAHTEYHDDYVALGVKRLARGDTRWVSGPPVARGSGPVSRAVALALRTFLGRGGSRKWATERGSEDGEYELDAGVFAGVWERETVLDYGGWDEAWVVNQDSEMAGRFLSRGERLICLPAMAAFYAPRNSIPGLWRQYLRYGEFREKTAVWHPQTMRKSHLLAPGVVLTAVAANVAPRPARTLARVGLAGYLAALLTAGALSRRDTEDSAEALLVPVVLGVMHFAHGSGFLRGAARHGPPLAAICNALGFKTLAERFAPPERSVFAPSLREHARPVEPAAVQAA